VPLRFCNLMRTAAVSAVPVVFAGGGHHHCGGSRARPGPAVLPRACSQATAASNTPTLYAAFVNANAGERW
jgi:hypothetical protein